VRPSQRWLVMSVERAGRSSVRMHPKAGRSAVRERTGAARTIHVVRTVRPGALLQHAGWPVSSLLCFVFALAGLSAANPSGISGYGLVTAMPASTLIGIAGLVLCFATGFVFRASPRWLTLTVVLMMTVLVLAPLAVEKEARFSTAWLHAGLAEYIGRTGHVLADRDARYSWPGFFAAAAAFAALGGVRPVQLLPLAPLVLNLLYLLPLTLLIRTFLQDARLRVVALLLWVVGNWVGQDYFAPQGLNIFLYLSFAALLLTCLSAEPAQGPGVRFLSFALRLKGPPLQLGDRQLGARGRTVVLVTLLLSYGASVVSHQLTQFFVLLMVLAVLVAGATKLRSLPAVLALLTVSYVLWGAQEYWIGHLADITGGIGRVQSSVQQNLTSRVASVTEPERLTVLRTRLAMTAALWALAIVGLLRRRRRAKTVLLMLASAPFGTLALQSYGGEALLRVHLASLPFLVILAADAFALPRATSRGSRAVAVVAMAAVTLAMTLGFLVARFGNEAFEQMTPSAVRGVQAFYRLAPPGATLFTLTHSTPGGYQEQESHVTQVLRPSPWDDYAAAMRTLDQASGPAYLLLTKEQWEHAKIQSSVSDAEARALQKALQARPDFATAWTDGSTVLLVTGVTRTGG